MISHAERPRLRAAWATDGSGRLVDGLALEDGTTQGLR